MSLPFALSLSLLSFNRAKPKRYTCIFYLFFSHMYISMLCTHILKIWGSRTTRACLTIMMMSQRGLRLILKEKKKRKMGISFASATLVLLIKNKTNKSSSFLLSRFSIVHIFSSLSLSLCFSLFRFSFFLSVLFFLFPV